MVVGGAVQTRSRWAGSWMWTDILGRVDSRL